MKTATLQRGLSLIELMVSVLIASFILSGAVVMFVSLKRSYVLAAQQAYIQENARFALAMLSAELRHAGYRGGCSTRAGVNYAYKPTTLQADFIATTPVTGYASNKPFPRAFDENLWDKDRNDAVIVRSVNADQRFTVISAPGATFKTIPDYDLKPGTMLLATNIDCSNMMLFSMQAIGRPPSAIGEYRAGSSFLPLTAKAFYIKPSSFDKKVPALGMTFLEESGSLRSEDLVPDIEHLQLTYGIDTTALSPDGQVNRYLRASDIAVDRATAASRWIGWDRVVSVHIDMVLRSRDPIQMSAVSTELLGITYHDRYLRQHVSRTVYLRNH